MATNENQGNEGQEQEAPQQEKMYAYHEESEEFPQVENQLDPKVLGILSYITPIGLIVAMVMNNPRDEYASFHLRQSLGVHLIGAAGSILSVIPFLGPLFWYVGILAMAVFWILAFMGATQAKKEPVPVLGPLFQKWFKLL